MKKIFSSLTLLLFFVYPLYAQYNLNMIDIEGMAVKTTNTYKDWQSSGNYVEGSMYMNDNFISGQFLLSKHDTLVSGIALRYNIFLKQMEMAYDNDTLVITKSERISYLIFDNKTFQYLSFLKKERIEKDYFQVLADGKYKFLLRRTVSFEPKNPPTTPYSAGYADDRFIHKDEYYLQKTNELAFLVKLNKKNLLSILSDKEGALKTFLAKNKLSLTKPEDVARLITFYNSLN